MGERREKAGQVRRVVGACVVWVVLGAVVNVGVAWGVTMNQARDEARERASRIPGRWEFDPLVVSVDTAQWPRKVPPEWPRECDRPSLWARSLTETLIASKREPREGRMQGWLVIRERAGWPARALESWKLIIDDGVDPDFWRESSVQLDTSWLREWPDWVILPIAPVWPGFAANTAVYGALAWFPWFVCVKARRVLRKRRGLCAGCGYDLRGLGDGAVCPECGKSRSAMSTAAERR